MSSRMKIFSGILGVLLLGVVGFAGYSAYSGKIGASADELVQTKISNIGKATDTLNLPESQNGVTVSIYDGVDQVKIGDKLTVTAKIKIGQTSSTTNCVKIGQSGDRNSMDALYVQVDYASNMFVYTTKADLCQGEFVYKFPYEVLAPTGEPGDLLTFSIYLAGKLSPSGQDIKIAARDSDRFSETSIVKAFTYLEGEEALVDANIGFPILIKSLIAINKSSKYSNFVAEDSGGKVVAWTQLLNKNDDYLVYQFTQALSEDTKYTIFGKISNTKKLLATFTTNDVGSNIYSYILFDKSYANIWPLGNDIRVMNLRKGLAIYYRIPQNSGYLELRNAKTNKLIRGSSSFDKNSGKLVFSISDGALSDGTQYKVSYKNTWWWSKSNLPAFNWYFTTAAQTSPTPPIACAADVKLCSNGSYVSRIAPNCEFAICPVVAPSSPTPLTTPPAAPSH